MSRPRVADLREQASGKARQQTLSARNLQARVASGKRNGERPGRSIDIQSMITKAKEGR